MVAKILLSILIIVPFFLFGQKGLVGNYTTSGLFDNIELKEDLNLFDDRYFTYFRYISSTGLVSSYGNFELKDDNIILHFSKIYIDTTHCGKKFDISDTLLFPSALSVKKNRNWRENDDERKLVKFPDSNQPKEISWIGRSYFYLTPLDKEYKFFLRRRKQLIKDNYISIKMSDCQISDKKYYFLGRESLIEQ